MAKLTEGLQPSLLDRLTDDEPEKQRESRDKRVLSLRRLRECVLRDLAWLLNSGNLGTTQDLDDYPLAKRSVVNYGLPDLAGRTASGMDIEEVERILRQTILNFEPRILRNSLKVKAILTSDDMSHNALNFDIEGELWAQPMPVHLFLKTELDLESGGVTITDEAGHVAG